MIKSHLLYQLSYRGLVGREMVLGSESSDKPPGCGISHGEVRGTGDTATGRIATRFSNAGYGVSMQALVLVTHVLANVATFARRWADWLGVNPLGLKLRLGPHLLEAPLRPQASVSTRLGIGVGPGPPGGRSSC